MPKAKRELDAYTLRWVAKNLTIDARQRVDAANAPDMDSADTAMQLLAIAAFCRHRVRLIRSAAKNADAYARTQKRRGRA